MRDEAEKRIGHLYPKVRVTTEMATDRPDLKDYVGRDLTVIAWLWARTVKSPNPAFADIDVPLASTFILSKKKGKGAYVEPVIDADGYRFTVRTGMPPEPAKRGTKSGGSGSTFLCLMSGVPMPFEYLRSEAKARRMGSRLMALVAQGDRGRLYLEPDRAHAVPARDVTPGDTPETSLPERALGFRVQEYGMTKWRDLFTPRQLVTLTTFSDLVAEARERLQQDAVTAGMLDGGDQLHDDGTGATAYADAVGVYLAVALSRLTDICNALCRWENTKTQVRHLFGRQAISMVWDYAENNAFGSAAGDYIVSLDNMSRALSILPATHLGLAEQHDAQQRSIRSHHVTSTDPPYYDNIGYADLSDFFYVWLRPPLKKTLPKLFSTLAVPKSDELVATPYRHGDKKRAETFFLEGMTQAMRHLADQAHAAFPVTIYYAFKQSEHRTDGAIASTGWETFLGAVMEAGLTVNGTWPVRTELGNRERNQGANALASSIVLVCRPRAANAPSATRREFQEALRTRFPKAMGDLQRSNIAPVDLAQASVGPGMAVFSRYQEVLNADGNKMSVRDALALINATLDEVLAEQEGDIDADTRWALTWFEQHGYTEGEYGIAEQLSKAKNTSVDGLVRAGIIESRRGTVRTLKPSELDPEWDPSTDSRLTVWEMTQHLIRLLESGGEAAAGELAAKLGSQAEAARDLAYRLYLVSERKRRAADALAYNGLVQSWPEIVRIAGEQRAMTATQGSLAIDGV